MTAPDELHARCCDEVMAALRFLVAERGLPPELVAAAMFTVGAGGLAFDPRRAGDLDNLRRIVRDLEDILARAESAAATPSPPHLN